MNEFSIQCMECRLEILKEIKRLEKIIETQNDEIRLAGEIIKNYKYILNQVKKMEEDYE